MKTGIKKSRKAAEAALDECGTLVWRLYRAGEKSEDPGKSSAAFLLEHIAEAARQLAGREDVAAFLEASGEADSMKSALQCYAMRTHTPNLPQRGREESAELLRTGLSTLRSWKANPVEHRPLPEDMQPGV